MAFSVWTTKDYVKVMTIRLFLNCTQLLTTAAILPRKKNAHATLSLSLYQSTSIWTSNVGLLAFGKVPVVTKNACFHLSHQVLKSQISTRPSVSWQQLPPSANLTSTWRVCLTNPVQGASMSSPLRVIKSSASKLFTVGHKRWHQWWMKLRILELNIRKYDQSMSSVQQNFQWPVSTSKTSRCFRAQVCRGTCRCSRATSKAPHQAHNILWECWFIMHRKYILVLFSCTDVPGRHPVLC